MTGHREATDRLTIGLSVAAAVFALPAMAHGLMTLWSLGTADKGDSPGPLLGVAIAEVTLPVLGALLGWAYARARRYPVRRVWRSAVVGVLIPSAVTDLALLVLFVFVVLAFSGLIHGTVRIM